ncbi:hypothetical protein CDAR_237871 [Caerostris darwini]|uniref:Uncharacterized protein n=1 Tax=Caerostris darwini TaxID=1538125 RepID=A0AAV4S4Q6_9ARAC|nr:hypothetical protein CDAR_237871 [Caerostris darwini]
METSRILVVEDYIPTPGRFWREVKRAAFSVEKIPIFSNIPWAPLLDGGFIPCKSEICARGCQCTIRLPPFISFANHSIPFLCLDYLGHPPDSPGLCSPGG